MHGIFDQLVDDEPEVEVDDEVEEVCDMITEEEENDCPLCQYHQNDASVIERMNQM